MAFGQHQNNQPASAGLLYVQVAQAKKIPAV
jgi:hypothetical protein